MNRAGVLIAMVLGLAACGGQVSNLGNTFVPGGGEAGTTLPGVFRDSDVSGLTYTSGPVISGISGAGGTFSYEAGSEVTWTIGTVTVGIVAGADVVTPLDITGAGTGSSETLNIVRFLMLLDNDGNPADGITISPAVQALAKNWAQVDFATTDLPSELAPIIDDLAAVNGETHILPSVTVAQAEITQTLMCSHSGGFSGSVFGTDGNGNIAYYVDPVTGLVHGFATLTPGASGITFPALISFETGSALSYIANGFPSFLTVETDPSFNLGFDSYDEVDGTWSIPNGADDGTDTVTSSRLDLTDQGAAYRFSGMYTGSGDGGAFSFGVTAQSATDIAISGVAYDMVSNQAPDLSGSVINSSTLQGAQTINITSSDNKTFIGTVNFQTGAMTGNWWATENTTGPPDGTFTGDGCQLN